MDMPIIADVKDHFALSFAAMNSPNYLEAYILKENGVYLVVKATLPATYENGAFERVSGNSDPYELVFSDGSKLYRDKVVPNNASRTIEIHFLLLPEMANKTIDEVSSSTSSTRMYVHVSYAGRNPVTYFSSRGFGLLVDPAWFNSTPSLTLTSPANNQTLEEGSAYTIAGSASDTDVGNAVTVKYAINGGTARNITSAVSDGSTPIPFSKTLTFRDGRLYDDTTDVSGPLAENTTYTVSVWAVDDQGGTSTSYTRTFTVILNRPPTVNLDPYSANRTGVSELETLTFTGTVTDPEGDAITLTAAFNGGAPVLVKSDVASGTAFSYSVPVASLQPGTNTLALTATDEKGASSKKTLTFAKSGTFTPVKTAVVRYAITPPVGTASEIATWVDREVGDLTVAAAASIVASDASESFEAMTLNASVPVGDGSVTEDEFVGTAAQAGAKVTLRLTLTRSDANSEQAVKRIMGGIA